MIAKAEQLSGLSLLHEQVMEAGRKALFGHQDDWKRDQEDWRAFCDASLSQDRKVSLPARKLSNALESLALLTPEQRRGFLVSAKDRVEFFNSQH